LKEDSTLSFSEEEFVWLDFEKYFRIFLFISGIIFSIWLFTVFLSDLLYRSDLRQISVQSRPGLSLLSNNKRKPPYLGGFLLLCLFFLKAEASSKGGSVLWRKQLEAFSGHPVFLSYRLQGLFFLFFLTLFSALTPLFS